jgi:hypothetical protein
MKHYLMLLTAALAIALSLIVSDVARADTSQRVNTTTLTNIVHRAQAAIWDHNIRKARAFKTTCAFRDPHGSTPHRYGGAWLCVHRVYRHSNFTGRLATIRLTTLMVPRYNGGLYEDGSGWAAYPTGDSKRRPRSVYMNVIRISP